MTTISADPSVPAADGTCFFDELPRELRDEIYRLTYTRDGECTLILQRGYSAQSGRHYLLLRAWKSGVAPFLVSKQWLTEALPQYFRHNRIHSRSADDLHDLFEILGSTLTKNLISLRFDCDYLPPAVILGKVRCSLAYRNGTVAQSFMDKHSFNRVGRLLSSCTHLSNLVVDVRAHWEWICFELPWDGEYQPHGNFWKWHVTRRFLALVHDLKELRGLQEFRLRQKPAWSSKTFDPKLIRDTMKVFEEQVRAKVTQPRGPPSG